MPPRVLLALLLLAAVCGAESAPAILQPVDTHSDCAIVLSLHNATTCELTRFEHAVRTRPPGCDVVALYNTKPARKALAGLIGHDATYAGFVTATRALRARASGVHVVPYGDAETKAALFGMGYSATALHMFSPYNSGLSKARASHATGTARVRRASAARASRQSTTRLECVSRRPRGLSGVRGRATASSGSQSWTCSSAAPGPPS